MHPKVCQAFGAIYVRVLFALSWLFVCKLSIKDGSTSSIPFKVIIIYDFLIIEIKFYNIGSFEIQKLIVG